MSFQKEIELVGQSDQSFDDAVQQGLAEATRRVQGINEIRITSWMVDVEYDTIVRYKVMMQVSCQGEQTQPSQAQFVQPAASGAMRPGDEALADSPGAGEDICPTCNGSGRLGGQTCPTCNGSGYIIAAIGGA